MLMIGRIEVKYLQDTRLKAYYCTTLHLHSHTDRFDFQRKINTRRTPITQPFAHLNPNKVCL